jgi:hypothetical protein
VSCEAGVGAESLSAGGVTDDDRGGHRPTAGLFQKCRAVLLDLVLELGEPIPFFTGDLTDPFHKRSRDS